MDGAAGTAGARACNPSAAILAAVLAARLVASAAAFAAPASAASCDSRSPFITRHTACPLLCGTPCAGLRAPLLARRSSSDRSCRSQKPDMAVSTARSTTTGLVSATEQQTRCPAMTRCGGRAMASRTRVKYSGVSAPSAPTTGARL